MIVLREEEVRAHLPWHALVEEISRAVLDPAIVAPPRLAYDLDAPSSNTQGHLLLMPAWHADTVVGLKTLTIWPPNALTPERVQSHRGNYLLLDAHSGVINAILDGAELTVRRTAAVSVLAARRLRSNAASRLLILGTGPIARNLALAHAAEGWTRRVEIYGRDQRRAEMLAAELTQQGLPCSASRDLATSVSAAGMVACATGAREPILKGEWLSPGTHVDLIGSYKPYMREADDMVIAKAAGIWTDTASAADESGDLLQPIMSGALRKEDIPGDLRALLTHGQRDNELDITVFKSVGLAVSDFAAARMAAKRATAAKPPLEPVVS